MSTGAVRGGKCLQVIRAEMSTGAVRGGRYLQVIRAEKSTVPEVPGQPLDARRQAEREPLAADAR